MKAVADATLSCLIIEIEIAGVRGELVDPERVQGSGESLDLIISE